MSQHTTNYDAVSNGIESTPEPLAVPAELDSAGTKLVYLYLRTAEEVTVDELRESLGMKTITLYPILSTLDRKGFVQQRGDTYRCSS
ncbi:helix-turn-helix domain-containing protein [Halegenticoccus tardaugens]|uniref:helix-turn-helix domain-containing protein n=1 Tax=Halegenticoccus tardaugens TaxID=2071624 RepID=UPI00100ADAB4|nr:helix-turn-helix domain-containing protein [Halegenticoccus tardaugens]